MDEGALHNLKLLRQGESWRMLIEPPPPDKGVNIDDSCYVRSWRAQPFANKTRLETLARFESLNGCSWRDYRSAEVMAAPPELPPQMSREEAFRGLNACSNYYTAFRQCFGSEARMFCDNDFELISLCKKQLKVLNKCVRQRDDKLLKRIQAMDSSNVAALSPEQKEEYLANLEAQHRYASYMATHYKNIPYNYDFNRWNREKAHVEKRLQRLQ